MASETRYRDENAAPEDIEACIRETPEISLPDQEPRSHALPVFASEDYFD
jgi:hypothetical protein